ncbi:recombination protein RecR [Candidatus Roizmanbacteria bacterium RIFCSPLOWO2_12_FULL_40_12]|uniref:Recombination protein RecR n=1 Tax=Candidatus Roizmanbacteria bacterium RIFCSPLOWO2_01_FULL_40_42 TaxID=1802066 RepID=A0A1F7J5J4_9BACT|nr:MAG: recombination protein RecR [Candidatus Roizmanbacteria bacterium RIFCSPHIGHO2_01_FULL_40_98]OGK28312.1 MAG: recombination protein RecR [Candidatus Roizmanbacteria bacterium RIFCSPHIGHO2_02_FULL_40_53]OGK30548.1 MAG: recombination protein RecR [Candidatus Roizmanbacteria bacterium RIFCSPHIGHO2_12_41_18]OGK36962.1 MAG: recombination protein RecR [Candidatus Roizmanbacteria bacterium RIFCSPHIGHO2_12_FULL_40_130]OGK50868.1 MAG: recombination protein RecR [Candidatus Roizmanbacteria bacteriu
MSSLPNNLKQIAFFLQRLPGIGEKTANRLAFYFLRIPQDDLEEFAQNVQELKEKTKMCKICLNLTEEEICAVCDNDNREKTTITVVEDVLDLLSFETGNIYTGVYHVLHGKIDPLNHVGPEDIHVKELLRRLENESKVKEVILATNLDMEGEATAMYIKNRIHDVHEKTKKSFKVTRLAYGLPMGANLEYADYMTLKRAIEGRNEY